MFSATPPALQPQKDRSEHYLMNVERLLQPGAKAPDFSLHTTPDQSVSLRDLLRGPLVLVFYPADWSPVCGDQLVLYNELLQDFRQHGASVAGTSVDGVWCHNAYSKDRKLRFPLLSDFEPKGEVARSYGAYRAQDGVCERALFVIDANGVIRWSYLSPVGVNPGADGILQALEGMQNEQAPSSSEKTSHEPTDRSSVRA